MRSSLPPIATSIVVAVLVVACASPASPSPAATSAPSLPPVPTASPTATVVRAGASPVVDPAPNQSARPSQEGGWPYISQIYAPVFGTDGTVFAMTETPPAPDGPRRGIVAFDAAGHVKPGWPIDERPDSYFGPMAAGPDGSVFLEECGGPELGCVLHRFGAAGRDLPGWPLALPPDFACPSRWPPLFLVPEFRFERDRIPDALAHGRRPAAPGDRPFRQGQVRMAGDPAREPVLVRHPGRLRRDALHPQRRRGKRGRATLGLHIRREGPTQAGRWRCRASTAYQARIRTGPWSPGP